MVGIDEMGGAVCKTWLPRLSRIFTKQSDKIFIGPNIGTSKTYKKYEKTHNKCYFLIHIENS